MLLRPSGLWERLTQLQDPLDKTHAASRITIVEDSFKMVRQRPLLGWGFGTFPIVYPSFRSFYTDLAVNAAHNDFVELLVETGLLGFALKVAFVYLLYRTGIPPKQQWGCLRCASAARTSPRPQKRRACPGRAADQRIGHAGPNRRLGSELQAHVDDRTHPSPQ